MNNYQFIVMQLKNDESCDDVVMIDHLADETGIDKGRIKKVVENHRSMFLRKPLLPDHIGAAIVKKTIEGDKTRLYCLECDHSFSRKIRKSTYEVQCPKCSGYDIELY